MLELIATALAKRGGDDDGFFKIWKRDGGGDDGFFNIWKRDGGDDGFFKIWKRDGGDDDFFKIWRRQEDDLGPFTKTAGSLIYLAVFVMLCFVGYVLFSVYPALAIVEDEKPPVYEPIPSNIDDAANPNGPKNANKNAPPPPYSTSAGGSSSASPDEAPVPVTSSLRRTYKLLKADGGNLRGLACAIARGVLSAPLIMIFALALGPHAVPFASLLASLVLVQYNVAWVHIVISRASPLRFWHRLPTFTSAFNSTWRVVVLRWAAMQVANAFPWIAMYFFGMEKLDKNTADFGRLPIVVLISFFSQLLIVLPAEIVFVRVLASTLPEDTEAVVSFDRTFEGKVEPAVIGGSGHVSIRDAWATFSKSAWRRLVKLYVKAIGIMMAAWLVLLPVGLLSMYVLAGERK